jgi:hypothetical protein
MGETAPSRTVRSRLDTQGYVDVDDATLKLVAPWVRWSPSICTAIVITGTALGSQWMLWGLAPFAVAGTLMSRHPFDYVYNLVVRRLTGTPPLPRHRAPRRFACGMAAAWTAATGAAFASGEPTLGYVLGGMLAAVGLLVSLTHFCIPSTIFGLLFGKPVARGAETA